MPHSKQRRLANARLESPAALWLLILLSALVVGIAAQGQTAAPSGQACVLVEKEGKVEVARKGTTAWSAGEINQSLQTGDRLRTGSRSRAALRWSESSVVRVSELTSMEIQPPAKPDDKPQLDLRSGATYLFSREKPTEIQFRTPVASGAIRGTEFVLEVAEDGKTVLSLVDGEVDLSSGTGGATSLRSGEQATVDPGGAMKKTALINTKNVIQWVLYYPVVVDPDDFGLSSQEKENYKTSVEAYRSGDLLGALGQFPENAAPGSDAGRSFHAAVLLAAGRVDQAEADLKNVQASSAPANALREIIAAVKHEKIGSSATPATASEWLAHSYYLQSQGSLGEALNAAREATAKSPRFGAAWIRLAELEFGFGHTAAAQAALSKGLELSPRNAEGLALNGYLFAAKNQFSQAEDYFDRAIAADGALANAWLGRGLVKIRKGLDRRLIDIGQPVETAGRQDLMVAATLEPQRAVLRSYLGKAYSQEHDLPHARKELDLAATLDPNDPTSWLYLALLNQQDNRVNEAVEDLEKSKDLNNNRSLFRSRLLLDQDQAVRGANLASMYRDVGMFDRSVQEAARAVNNDYGNYSAHLFLANSYDALRDPKLINLRYETPWFSELMLADLLMPVNGGNLSQNISQQEYSKLFASDGLGIFSRTEYSTRGNWLESASQYGVFGNSSYSLDAFYRSENGYRPNNNLEQLSLTARFKQQLTDKDSVFFQIGYFNSDSGDVAQYYYQSNASPAFHAKERQEPSLLAGYHREWAPGSHTLFLFSRFDDTLFLSDASANPLARTSYTFTDTNGVPIGTNDFIWTPNRTSLGYDSKLEAYSGELQQIFQTPCQTMIAGIRYQAGWSTTETHLLRPADPGNPFSVPIDVRQKFDSELDRFSVYGYEQWQALDSLRLIGGVSYDRLHFPRNIDTSPITPEEATTDRISPKAGFIWSPGRDSNFRGVYTRSLGGVFFDQSVRLEPVQIAGFNDAFRSLIPESVAGLAPGTRFETWGLGFDHRIEPTRTYFLVQGEILQSDVTRTLGLLTNNVSGPAPLTPDQPSSVRQSLDYQESSLIVAVNQLLGDEWALGGRYKLAYADLDANASIPASVSGSSALRPDVSARLHQLDLYAIYQHRSGFFGQFDAIWSDQANFGYSPSLPSSDFWQFNLYAGYRFLQRRAEARIGFLNLGDKDYHLNPLTLYNELPRGRMVTLSLKLNF